MAARMHRIDPEVLQVLSIATIDGQVVRPFPQLDRKLYERVDKVLRAIGGKWKTRVGHVFPEDPAPRLEQAILTAQVECPKLNAFFPTPRELAERMAMLAGVEYLGPADYVLEPSAGRGAILDVLAERTQAQLLAVEMMVSNWESLCSRNYGPVLGDFMEYQPPRPVSAVVMNPPFEKQQDIAHVTRAFGMLEPGGSLVAVMAAGITFRQDRKTQEFLYELPNVSYRSIEALPEGTFKESGTMVNTVLVHLRRSE